MARRKDEEVTRLLEYLRTTDKAVVGLLSVSQIVKHLKLNLNVEYARKLIKQFYKDSKTNQEVNMPPIKEKLTPEILLEELAAVASKTYAYIGDGEKVSSEDAAKDFVRLMKRYDPALLERGLRRQLPK
jgi:hypothetical protein